MAVSYTVAQVLDCKGLNCPLPVIKTKKAIEQLAIGQVLAVIATDPGSKPDMAAWSRTTGHELLETKEEPGVYTFFVRKAK